MKIITNKIISVISNEEASVYADGGLVVENCIIGLLDLTAIVFQSGVTIKNCIINELKIHSTWFSEGLIFTDNVVLSDIMHEMGGHNDGTITLSGNIFHGFFCFFDCQFTGQVIIRNNIFVKGSDLLYRENKGFDNLFDGGIILENNIGELDTIENCPPM